MTNRTPTPAVNCLMRHFGSTVRRLREQRDWSQEQLAEHANLNRSFVGELERGQATASLLTLEKLAHAFGMAISDLLYQTEQQVQGHARPAIDLTAIAC